MFFIGIDLHLICCLWGVATLLLKDDNMLDCDFNENVLSLILDNGFVVINNAAAELMPKNVGRNSRLQHSVEKF